MGLVKNECNNDYQNLGINERNKKETVIVI